MNINARLSQFSQEELVLGRTDTERKKINKSLDHLEDVIKDNLHITEFIRFGSFQRNTILPRKYDEQSDVDLMVVFYESQYQPETYRTQLKNVLSRAYPNSLSKKDFPAVKLELNHIKFDIVPAIRINNLWQNTFYSIPDKNNEWQKTVPNDINDGLSDLNQRLGDNKVRQVIRLCKHWNASFGRPFSSYDMEGKILIKIDWHVSKSDNTYTAFLTVLKKLANDINHTKTLNIINDIESNQTKWFNDHENIEKQWEGICLLLPGIK